MNGFFTSWTPPICSANLVLFVKILPRISHLNIFFLFMIWRNLSFRFVFHYELIWITSLKTFPKVFVFLFFNDYHSGCQVTEWLENVCFNFFENSHFVCKSRNLSPVYATESLFSLLYNAYLGVEKSLSLLSCQHHVRPLNHIYFNIKRGHISTQTIFI